MPNHQYFQNGQHPWVYGPHQRTKLQVIVLNSHLSPKHRVSASDLRKGLHIGKLLYFFQLYQEELEWKDTARLGHPEDEAPATLPVLRESLTARCPGAANWKVHRITALGSAQAATTRGYSQLNQHLTQAGQTERPKPSHVPCWHFLWFREPRTGG